ncbi:unnamed protein product [Blepharisma stoltei]|uniref:Uncharacterized protein n=1 Tax=Blepharisma stoltei TaxID=1481888 RepID=A0AAU9JH00_9CILI|nr:unnamed protein product [Blepharisma stoltei]
MLYLASKNNKIFLTIPKTIIYGFGFKDLTMISTVEKTMHFQEISLTNLHRFLNEFEYEDKNFPFAVFKTKDSITLVNNPQEAYTLIEKNVKIRYEFSLQQYIISPGDYTQIVRVSKNSANRISAKIIKNKYSFICQKKNHVMLNPNLNFFLTTTEEKEQKYSDFQPLTKSFIIIRGICVGKGSISMSTIELSQSIDWIYSILKAVLLHRTVMKVSANFIMSKNNEWFLISLHSCHISEKKAEISFFRRKSTETPSMIGKLNRTVATGHDLLNLTICSKNHEDIDKTFMGNNTPSLELNKIFNKDPITPQKIKQKPPLARSQTVKKIPPVIETIENDIDTLIGKDRLKDLKYMNYQKWLKRREDKLPDMMLEKTYAKQISTFHDAVKKKHNSSLNLLKNLKQTMEDIVSINSLKGEFVVKDASKLLLTKNFKRHLNWFAEDNKNDEEDDKVSSIRASFTQAFKDKCVENVILNGCQRLESLKRKRSIKK